MRVKASADDALHTYFVFWDDVKIITDSSESTIRRAIRRKEFPAQFLFLEIKEELDLEGQMFICGVKGSGVQKVQCDACHKLKVDKKANTNRKREVGETLDWLLFGNRQNT